MTTLSIGTKLENEYGIWTIIDITHYAGCKWYDLIGEQGHVVAYPSQIGTDYKVVS
jgi:hypothetical protein